MKISIIGANSYIARNFVYYLVKQNDEKIMLKLYDIQDISYDGYECYTKIDFEFPKFFLRMNGFFLYRIVCYAL